MLDHAREQLARAREALGEDGYAKERSAFQSFLCSYFDSGHCRHRMGSIAPMASSNTPRGGKCLKVRWGLPGSGKSGGLRLALVVYCEMREVKVVGAWTRRDDPSDAEFGSAFGTA